MSESKQSKSDEEGFGGYVKDHLVNKSAEEDDFASCSSSAFNSH